MKKERLGNIDFFKFIGVLAIIWFHMNICMFHFYTDTIPLFVKTTRNSCSAGMWTELFFIISGFFLFKNPKRVSLSVFLLKRYLRLYPVVFFCLFLYWFFDALGLLSYRGSENVLTMLSLNGTAIAGPFMGNIHPSWFVSVLLWASFILVWLKQLLPEKWFNFSVFLIIFIGLGYISSHDTKVWLIVGKTISIGFLKGLICLSIGYAIKVFYDKFKNLWLNKKSLIVSLILTMLECYFFKFLIFNTCFHKMNFSMAYPLILLAEIGLVVCFLVNKSFISKFLNNRFSNFLGNISYSILMSHIIILDFFSKNIFPKHFSLLALYPYLMILIIMLLSIILGLIIHYFFEKSCSNYVNKLLKQIEIFNTLQRVDTLVDCASNPLESGGTCVQK